jgi:hypothetical protein
MPTWLLRFDKQGVCQSPQTRTALLEHLRTVARSDVILFSHGWNNDFDTAAALYAEFLRHFEQAVASHPPNRDFNPLFIGVVWPSTWLVFDNGPAIAAAVDAMPSREMQTAIDDMVERLRVAGGAAGLERFYALLEKTRLSGAEVAEFAALVAPAFGTVKDEETGGVERKADVQSVMDMLQAAQALQRRSTGPAPNIDDWGTGAATRPSGAVDGGPEAAGLFEFLDPRHAVRLFSLYQMKDRAGTVGYHGIAALLRDVLTASAAAGTRLHAVGHSFGCKVVLSAICAPAPMPRPVSSVLLLQPAISYLCFAEKVPDTQQPGGYRSALDGSRVRGPIFSTYSKQDFPLHQTFHIALRRRDDAGELQIAAAGVTSAGEPPSRFSALGGYGPRGAGQKLVEPLPAAGTPYPADLTAPIVAFDGSQGLITGHGDVKNDATAWALHRLVFR